VSDPCCWTFSPSNVAGISGVQIGPGATALTRIPLSWGDTEAYDDELIEAAKKAQIHESIDLFPKKYETRVGQKGVNLSGGQKKALTSQLATLMKMKISMQIKR